MSGKVVNFLVKCNLLTLSTFWYFFLHWLAILTNGKKENSHERVQDFGQIPFCLALSTITRRTLRRISSTPPHRADSLSRKPAECPTHSLGLDIMRQPFSNESTSTCVVNLRGEFWPASLPFSLFPTFPTSMPDSPIIHRSLPPTVAVLHQLAWQHNGSLWAAVLRGTGWQW